MWKFNSIIILEFEFASLLTGQTVELLTLDGKEIHNFYLDESYEINIYHLLL
jgi:hypothetical protein